MSNIEIEKSVSKALNQKLTEAVNECVKELNEQGHSFELTGEALFEWRDGSSDRYLTIDCITGVRCKEQPRAERIEDPVTESFIARAESGKDREAEMLNILEGDINNGGFFQLYDNKGIGFMKDGARLLEKIGSKSTLKLVRQAITVIDDSDKTIDDYEIFQKTLQKFDARFYHLKENIAVLFENYRARSS